MAEGTCSPHHEREAALGGRVGEGGEAFRPHPRDLLLPPKRQHKSQCRGGVPGTGRLPRVP